MIIIWINDINDNNVNNDINDNNNNVYVMCVLMCVLMK